MERPTSYATTHRWWVRPVRWLWRILCFFWATVFVGLVLGFIPAVLFLTRGTDPHTLIVGVILDWVGQHQVLSLVVSLLFVALTALTWLVVRRFNSVFVQQGSISVFTLECNRAALVRTLRKEYSKQLTYSLQGVAMVALGLHERTDRTRSSAQFAFYRSEAAGAHPLPPGTSIMQVYDEAAQSLLILGEPGAGKTTLLLDLAGELLTRAEGDPGHPIPVIFNLSSWANKKLPLDTWLIDQLQLVYNVPYRLGRAGFEQEKWLLLLDGLDEVEESVRGDCTETINSYRKAHFVPLVVCSRTADYEAIAPKQPLALQSAVVVQPLTPEQVDAFLLSAGGQVSGLREALQIDRVLRELAFSPLMLSTMAIAYQGMPVEDLVTNAGSSATRRQEVWATYIQKRLDHPRRNRYPPEQTLKWLAWLASQMAQHSQKEFYIEKMRPDWLPTDLRRLRRLLVALGGGLLYGSSGGLGLGLVYFGNIGAGMVTGMILGLPVALALSQIGDSLDEFEKETSHLRPKHGVWAIPFGLIIGLLVWSADGLPFGVFVMAFLSLLGFGITALPYNILRVLLWLSGRTPFRYDRFLDYAAEHILLRKVGQGYGFIHELLRDYFAEMNPSSSSSKDAGHA